MINYMQFQTMIPFSKANVLSRGIVGSKCGTPKVASPIYKQQFDLTNGCCIDNSNVTVPTYQFSYRMVLFTFLLRRIVFNYGPNK